jgi:hypothetical protein
MRKVLVAAALLTALAVLPALPAAGYTAAVTCGGLALTDMGTPGDDVIDGTPGVDVIHGLGGNDVIRGFGGADVLYGGAGSDELRGGPGADTLYGGIGSDVLFGGGGADVIHGGDGRDALKGSSGADELRGGKHRDLVLGGWGDDSLFGGLGQDFLRGSFGVDSADGGANVDTCLAESRTSCTLPDANRRLKANGIGSVSFGLETEFALLELAALLGDAADEGDPDEDSGWIDSFSIYGTCPGTHVRMVRWGDVRTFHTRNGLADPGEFFTYDVSDPANNREDKRLITADGIRWNDTVGQLEAAYGTRVTIDFDDVFMFWFFHVDGNPSGLRGFLPGSDHFDHITLLGAGIGCGE